MIYFDAAATTLEKPEAVSRAASSAIRSLASPGRGGHSAARRAEEIAFRCRAEAAELFGVPSPERVIFTFNATHGLNLAIRTLVKPGSHVIISGYEHNAVTRTLRAVGNISVTVVDTPLFFPDAAIEEFEQAIKQGADAVICNHVSNVFGYILPLEKIAEFCRKSGVPLIVDASQSAGVLPVSLAELGAAYIAMPGHKGLYGPQGTGLLLCGESTAEPILYGGTGSASRLQEMPEDLPDRLESGTHNMPGIAGLLEGLRFVKRTGMERIGRHERDLAAYAARLLNQVPGVRVFASADLSHQSGVISFRVKDRDCEELAAALSRRAVAVRAGLHCAPLAHKTAGTLEGGTVRMSFSAFNTPVQVEAFTGILRQVLREKVTF